MSDHENTSVAGPRRRLESPARREDTPLADNCLSLCGPDHAKVTRAAAAILRPFSTGTPIRLPYSSMSRRSS